MQELVKVFRFESNPVSTVLDSKDNKTVWYRLTHVCKVLGFSNPQVAMKNHVTKRTREIHTGKGRAAAYIQRLDVIRLTFASKKECAERLQDWVIDLLEQYWDNGAVISPDITKEQAVAAKQQLDRILNATAL